MAQADLFCAMCGNPSRRPSARPTAATKLAESEHRDGSSHQSESLPKPIAATGNGVPKWVWVAAAIVGAILLASLSGGASPQNPLDRRSDDHLPIIEGPFKECLLRHGYDTAYTMDELDRNIRALELCEGIPP